MKKLMVLLLVGCVVVLSQGFRTVAVGDEGEIPLSKLAGTYSITERGSLFFCVKDTAPFPPAACYSAGSLGSPLTVIGVGSVTSAKQTACSTVTETLSDLPVDVSPPAVAVQHTATTLISYDPVTGTGDLSFTSYSGGHCTGASFDTTGATVISSGTEHFTASNRGKQIDFDVTSLSSPVGAVGDFSISGTLLRH